MKLAAQLSRQFARQVTPGQVMVASTVAKLATIIDGEEDSTRRMGFETILPLREGNGPTLFCFHPASGFAWQFSVLSRYLDPQWSIIGIQSPRPHGPMQTAANLDEVCEAHLATLFEQQPHGPYYLLGYSLGGTLAQGIAARLRARGEQAKPDAGWKRWHFLACWIPGRQKRKTGRKKKPMVWTRKCWRRLTASAKPSWRHSREVLQRSCLPPLKATTLMLCAC
ncbi:hypothetical protein EIMP300_71930 [Escherichia coli]|uniref:Thioesterase domain-containing protein n=1 Tax=Escherichia coli TaxID=562 RepID=A0A8S0G114_ECOLX|nr:hypothetical protein EIMP300_71930 [Escherichia coli]